MCNYLKTFRSSTWNSACHSNREAIQQGVACGYPIIFEKHLEPVIRRSEFVKAWIFCTGLQGHFIMLQKELNGKWWCPGGAVETTDVNTRVAISRETREEAGIELSPCDWTWIGKEVSSSGVTCHNYVYHLVGDKVSFVKDPDEHSLAAKFMDLNEFIMLTHSSEVKTLLRFDHVGDPLMDHLKAFFRKDYKAALAAPQGSTRPTIYDLHQKWNENTPSPLKRKKGTMPLPTPPPKGAGGDAEVEILTMGPTTSHHNTGSKIPRQAPPQTPLLQTPLTLSEGHGESHTPTREPTRMPPPAIPAGRHTHTHNNNLPPLHNRHLHSHQLHQQHSYPLHHNLDSGNYYKQLLHYHSHPPHQRVGHPTRTPYMN
jgi:8-oxo-dGTP pyrophosphatase MutT (NUDIX family)